MSEVANTEKFIKSVRERSLLYDLSHVDYKNREKKAEAWLEVAAEMGIGESKIWIAKWKSLRDNYNKFKKNNESSTSQAYKKYKKWPWASQMRFLDDFNGRKVTESNSQPQEPETVNHSVLQPDTDNLNSSVDKSKIDDAHEVPENAAGSQIRRKRMKTSDKTLEFSTELKLKNKKQPKIDGVDHFFLSYAQTFKSFPPRIQSMVKLEIATLFARYELQVEGGSEACAFGFPPQSPYQRFRSPTSGSAPSPKYEQDSSSSWAVLSPISQITEPPSAIASNYQESKPVFVLPHDSSSQSTKELS